MSDTLNNLKVWRDALKSGNYEQCQSMLVDEEYDYGDENSKSNKTYCCIGVAATCKGESFEYLAKHANEFMDHSIYNEVAEWLGLKLFDSNPKHDLDEQAKTLKSIAHFIYMNDRKNANFEQIAKDVDKLIKREEAKLAKKTKKEN
jgi:hypothetical protein